MSKIDLGSVSAYDIAVKNGYAGTEADWVNEITNASSAIPNINLLSARVDEIASLDEGSTTGDAELADIRVGYDGTTYANAGTAVRTQVGNLATVTGNLEDLETEEKTNLVDAINEAAKSGGGGGLTDTQKDLLIRILRAALYSSDQSTNIDALEEAFNKTVVYLSATLNLGTNVIYSDDTLDSLRKYLVVAATYDDQTKQVVTGYVLSGTLTVGTSTITISYKNVLTTVDVPVSQAVTRYSITNNLTGVTNSNTDTTIPEGNTYIGFLTADTAGYIPTGVSVKVGGVNVTSTAYDVSTHSITIEDVQGDIVITATADEDPTAPVFALASPMTESGTIEYSLFDQDRDWTIEYTINTPANSGAVTIRNNVPGQAYYPFSAYTNYGQGTGNIKIWNGSNNSLNRDWLDGTVAGTQKNVITHDADGETKGYWKQTNMKSGRESYGQGSKTLTVGTTITPNEEPFTTDISGGATLSDFKIYKRILTAEEISEYVGWTVE